MTFQQNKLLLCAALLGASVWLAACAGAPPDAAAPAPSASAREALQAFPERLQGLQRYVIDVPALPHEGERKLELMGGKVMRVDCNTRALSGRFEAHEVPGWGYTYWVLRSSGNAASTLMACPPGSERTGFVAAPSQLLRYNSELPVVVFMPEGMTLRWRVWQAGAVHEAAVR